MGSLLLGHGGKVTGGGLLLRGRERGKKRGNGKGIPPKVNYKCSGAHLTMEHTSLNQSYSSPLFTAQLMASILNMEVKGATPLLRQLSP